MFDPSKIQSDSHPFNPVTPLGDTLKDVTLTIRSSSHPKVKEVSRQLQLEEDNREKMLAKRGRKPTDPITEEDLQWQEDLLHRRIALRVENIAGMELDGKPVGSDEKLIAEVVSKYEWIAVQVLKESTEPTNFFRARAKSSD